MDKSKLSSKIKEICWCCNQIKEVALVAEDISTYVLQDGSTAWVCDDCRSGKHLKK